MQSKTEDGYKVGEFYMVHVTDPDTTEEWEQGDQPARFAGYDVDGNETWNFLDPEASCWSVRTARLIQ